jgi:hypothetical protein
MFGWQPAVKVSMMMIIPPPQRQLGGTRCRFKHNLSSSIRGNRWALTFGNKWGTLLLCDAPPQEHEAERLGSN